MLERAILLVSLVACAGAPHSQPANTGAGPDLTGKYTASGTTCDSRAEDATCFDVTNHVTVSADRKVEISIAGTGGQDCEVSDQLLTQIDGTHFTFSVETEPVCTGHLAFERDALHVTFSGECERPCVPSSFDPTPRPIAAK